MICRNCGRNNPDNEENCIFCGTKLNGNNSNNYPIMPMRWYSFLVWLFLPINIFSNLMDGIQLLANPEVTGIDISGLGDVSTQALEKLNVFSGICMIVIAVFMIYTWNSLRKLLKSSLLCIQTIYCANAIVNCVNGGLMYYILGSQAKLAVFSLVFANVFTAVFIVIANTVYFIKRKHIFIN